MCVGIFGATTENTTVNRSFPRNRPMLFRTIADGGDAGRLEPHSDVGRIARPQTPPAAQAAGATSWVPSAVTLDFMSERPCP